MHKSHASTSTADTQHTRSPHVQAQPFNPGTHRVFIASSREATLPDDAAATAALSGTPAPEATQSAPRRFANAIMSTLSRSAPLSRSEESLPFDANAAAASASTSQPASPSSASGVETRGSAAPHRFHSSGSLSDGARDEMHRRSKHGENGRHADFLNGASHPGDLVITIHDPAAGDTGADGRGGGGDDDDDVDEGVRAEQYARSNVSMGARWRDVCRQNELRTEDIHFYHDHITKAILMDYSEPISLLQVNDADIVRCRNTGKLPSECTLCESGARRYLSRFHVAKMSRTYYIMRWLHQEGIVPSIAQVEIRERQQSLISHFFSKTTVASGGRGSAKANVVVAERCALPFVIPWLNPLTPRTARRELDQHEATTHGAGRLQPLLGEQWRNVFYRKNAISDEQKLRLRAHVFAQLGDSCVRKISVTQLKMNEMTPCSLRNIDIGVDFACKSAIKMRFDDAPTTKSSDCALCRQNAFRANGIHIVPYTRAHFLADWLIADEDLTVLIEYMPSSDEINGNDDDGDERDDGAPIMQMASRRVPAGMSSYALYVVGNIVTEAALVSAERARRSASMAAGLGDGAEHGSADDDDDGDDYT